MGMFDVEYTFDNLLRTSSDGIEMSSFVQMKDAIAKRYKEIFGNDIDLDSASADGQYLMMIALMLFNGYSGLYYLNQNLDPSGAQGTFLNRLCSFNNVFRKSSEPSYAYLYVSYIGTINEYVSVMGDNTNVQEITCIDKAGKTWKWEEGKGIDDFITKFSQGQEPWLLKFVCQENGPITAEADATLKDINPRSLESGDLTDDNHGWISQTIDKSVYPFEVWQASDAVVGHDEETDTALRQRRLLEIGNNGVTVLNGVRGSLSEIQGVEEVKVYTNVTERTANTFRTKDGSDIEFHDVYLAIRYKEGVEVSDTLIGQTIYNKMTPGIVTAPLNRGYDELSSSYTLTQENIFGYNKSYEVNIYQGILRDMVYWKKCKPVNPAITLKFMFNKNYYSKGMTGTTNYEQTSDTTFIKGVQYYLDNQGAVATPQNCNNGGKLYEQVSGSYFETTDTYFKEKTYYSNNSGTIATPQNCGLYKGTTYVVKEDYSSFEQMIINSIKKYF